MPEARPTRRFLSLRFNRPSGTGYLLNAPDPALKGRAIVSRPSGTKGRRISAIAKDPD